MCRPKRWASYEPSRQKKPRSRLFLQHDGQFERRPVAGRAEVLHQRTNGAREADDERLGRVKLEPVRALESISVPAAIRAPVLEDGRDARRCELLGARRIAELRQGAEGMKPLAHVVRIERPQAAAARAAAQWQRKWAAVREKRGSRVLRHGRCINGNARRIFSVEQRVQVPARYVRI